MVVIFRHGAGKESVFKSKLDALGIPEHDNADQRHELRKRNGIFFGGSITDIHGNTFVRAIIDEKDAGRFSQNDHNPAFAIVWRSDVFDDDGNILPEPEVEIERTDIDGNTYPCFQRVGTF